MGNGKGKECGLTTVRETKKKHDISSSRDLEICSLYCFARHLEEQGFSEYADAVLLMQPIASVEGSPYPDYDVPKCTIQSFAFERSNKLDPETIWRFRLADVLKLREFLATYMDATKLTSETKNACKIPFNSVKIMLKEMQDDPNYKYLIQALLKAIPFALAFDERTYLNRETLQDFLEKRSSYWLRNNFNPMLRFTQKDALHLWLLESFYVEFLAKCNEINQLILSQPLE